MHAGAVRFRDGNFGTAIGYGFAVASAEIPASHLHTELKTTVAAVYNFVIQIGGKTNIAAEIKS